MITVLLAFGAISFWCGAMACAEMAGKTKNDDYRAGAAILSIIVFAYMGGIFWINR